MFGTGRMCVVLACRRVGITKSFPALEGHSLRSISSSVQFISHLILGLPAPLCLSV
jgi:hypothetical protein